MEAIILAGGLGTRLRSVVSDLPKPMAPINNKPFLAYLIQYWASQGITRFVLSVGYKYQSIKDYFGESFQDVIIDYAIEESPMGTGGGLLNACKKLTGNDMTLVLNGDTFFAIPLSSLLEHHKNNQAYLTIAASQAINTRYNNLILGENDKINKIANDQSNEFVLVNGGVYLFETSQLICRVRDFLAPCSLENDLLPSWVETERVYAYLSNKYFIDIGIPADYLKVCNGLM